eukprot:scaffold1954_cov268-Pinguiococcus_pyrenoidosus.AAC.19
MNGLPHHPSASLSERKSVAFGGGGGGEGEGRERERARAGARERVLLSIGSEGESIAHEHSKASRIPFLSSPVWHLPSLKYSSMHINGSRGVHLFFTSHLVEAIVQPGGNLRSLSTSTGPPWLLVGPCSFAGHRGKSACHCWLPTGFYSTNVPSPSCSRAWARVSLCCFKKRYSCSRSLRPKATLPRTASSSFAGWVMLPPSESPDTSALKSGTWSLSRSTSRCAASWLGTTGEDLTAFRLARNVICLPLRSAQRKAPIESIGPLCSFREDLRTSRESLRRREGPRNHCGER